MKAPVCAQCLKPVELPVKRKIVDIGAEYINGRLRRFVRTREMVFCSEEHVAHYQMGCEG